MIIIVVGTPGVGKSTILKVLQNTYPSINTINYDKVILKKPKCAS